MVATNPNQNPLYGGAAGKPNDRGKTEKETFYFFRPASSHTRRTALVFRLPFVEPLLHRHVVQAEEVGADAHVLNSVTAAVAHRGTAVGEEDPQDVLACLQRVV